MGKRSIAFIAICGLIGLAVVLSSCGDFFVSPNSLDHLQVTPTSAVLSSSGAPPATMQFTATAVNVNSSSLDVTSNVLTAWNTSPNNTIVSVTNGQATPIATGQAVITAVYKGKTSNQVPVLVRTNTLSTITVSAGSTNVAAGGSTTITVTDNNGLQIPASYASWTVSSTAGTITTTANTNPATLTVAVGTTFGTQIVVTATVNTNTNGTVTNTVTITSS